MTKICCVCQRVENGAHWKNDYEFADNERVTHGYCPLCFDVIMAELMDSRDELSGREDVVHSHCQDDQSSALCV